MVGEGIEEGAGDGKSPPLLGDVEFGVGDGHREIEAARERKAMIFHDGGHGTPVAGQEECDLRLGRTLTCVFAAIGDDLPEGGGEGIAPGTGGDTLGVAS